MEDWVLDAMLQREADQAGAGREEDASWGIRQAWVPANPGSVWWPSPGATHSGL